MMKEPWFWRAQTPGARALALTLSPLSVLYDAGRRLSAAAARPERPPVPVVCVGNATLGGVGKTPFALMLAPLLAERGMRPGFLTRGYGGREAGPLAVDPSVHGAVEVGDEALLLAAVAPTVVARNRPAGARLAAGRGADVIVMDDGFQNSTVEKTFSILLVDATDNAARLFPAGPLREPLSEALARADAVVSVAADADASPPPAAPGKPCFRAFLAPQIDGGGARVLAFCGIGRPPKFFAALKRQGFLVAAERAFADHHRYSAADIGALRKDAAAQSAALITTAKDFVRMPLNLREGVRVFPVAMRMDEPARLVQMIAAAAESFAVRRHV